MKDRHIEIVDSLPDEIMAGAKRVAEALERLAGELREIQAVEREIARAQVESPEGDLTRIDVAMEKKIFLVEAIPGKMLSIEGEIDELVELLTIDVRQGFREVADELKGINKG